MAMADNKVVVGVFAERALAQQALQELRQAGFTDDHIGFVERDQGAKTEALSERETREPGEDEVAERANTAAGMVTGGVVGGVVGAVAALLLPGIGPAVAGGILITTLGGAALGAAAGGLIGTLVHIGVPEEEAHYYEREFQSGRTIVIVQADERPLDAFHILERNQAYNASTPTRVDDSQATVELKPLDPQATVELKPLDQQP